MGNQLICKRRKLRSKSRPTGFVHHQTSPSQIGIRTVDVDNTCNFSTTSNLCISIVTWNMNGQVSFEDLAEMVGSNRDFDLLAVGLQEAPGNKMATMLSAALDESHICTCLDQRMQDHSFKNYKWTKNLLGGVEE